jgi:hypothetical protein
MSNETTKSGKLGEWQRLQTAIEANQDDLSELAGSLARFQTALGQAEQLAGRQAAHAASKQETTRLLNEVMAECQRLSTILRLAVKQHYGIRSEKLTEFGLQPFRGRLRKTDEEPAPSETEAPTDSAG